ncbi:unnamed protein product [Lactuca saligna]|uniref:Uncharacterized protein n=1 Tax=Lactuca saligna TaxID=75948 RepID=A0AA35ZL27_LACSI|nr:unnamed protein product [Lactuca saligna]
MALLSIKPKQNFIIDLNSSKYYEAIQTMIEFLLYSPMAPTLTMAQHDPLVLLSEGFSTARHQQSEALISFEVDSIKTTISKARFSFLLVFSQLRDLVDIESIYSSDLLEMFFQMGCLDNLTILSKFKKPNLLLMWNGLFTLLFKSFSKLVTSSESASNIF